MATTIQTSTGPAVPADQSAASANVVGRRRRMPHILAGAMLVLVCAVGFAVTALHVDARTAVLALARAVSAGHTLSVADLTVMRIVPDPASAVISQTRQPSVIGRTVRLPVAAHTLLSEALLGPAAWPPPEQSLVAVLVQPGRAPDGLVAGTHVLVLVVPAISNTGEGSGGNTMRATATVMSVGAADGQGGRVVSLLLPSPDAVQVAEAVGEVALVIQGEGG
jgi:hypothetical protein